MRLIKFDKILPENKGLIVENPKSYLYSGTRNYADMENILDVIIIDLPWKTNC